MCGCVNGRGLHKHFNSPNAWENGGLIPEESDFQKICSLRYTGVENILQRL